MRFLAPAFILFSFLAAPPAAAADDGTGAAVYKRCAACHLPNRAGVPGTFPPLDQHVAAMAESKEGREYLVAAISRGVVGEMEVNGVTYRGMMPPQSSLKDDQLAAVLNLLTEGGDAAPFTPEEVASLRARHAKSSAREVRALRDLVPTGGGSSK